MARRNYKMPAFSLAQEAYKEARKQGLAMDEAHIAYGKVYYEVRKSLGVCPACGKPAIPGKTLCSACAERNSARVRELRSRGLCICGTPARPGRTTCEVCAKISHLKYLERKAKKIG